MTDDPEGFRDDLQRSDEEALGRAMAEVAARLLAEGNSPRTVVSGFMGAALGISLRHLGRDATAEWLLEVSGDVATMPAGGGCAGTA